VALSRGVIALSRLDIKDKWPSFLMKDELARERQAYEVAYQKARDKIISGNYAIEEILGLDTALNALNQKIATEIPNERGFRAQAISFVKDLRDATRMFDANSVDYAREILVDTKDHDATTVQELVEFMSKYRLQFATSGSSPSARVMYGQIYERLRKQTDAFNLKTPDFASLPLGPGSDKPSGESAGKKNSGGKLVPLFNGKDTAGLLFQPAAAGNQTPRPFVVEKGVLVGRTTSDKPKPYWVLSEREFADFVLRAQFSLDPKSAGGVALRAEPKEAGPKGFYLGPLLQLAAPGSTSADTGDSFHLRDDRNKRDRDAQINVGADQWNELEVMMKGPSVAAFVNGKPILELNTGSTGAKGKGKDKGKTKPGLQRPDGRVGFEVFQGTIRFRNVELFELPSSK
jgi:hypothetical protein